jgi:hypothetical protein
MYVCTIYSTELKIMIDIYMQYIYIYAIMIRIIIVIDFPCHISHYDNNYNITYFTEREDYTMQPARGI